MKKTQKEAKKLHLNRETLRQLQDVQLAEVVRGGCTGRTACDTSIGETCCNHH